MPYLDERSGDVIAMITLAGYLGTDPEARALQNGGQLAVFRVGVSVGKDKTDWYTVECWSTHTREFAQRHLKKGSAVIVVGGLKQDVYQDKTRLVVRADTVTFSPQRSQGQAAPQPGEQTPNYAQQYAAAPPAPPPVQYAPQQTPGGYWPGPGMGGSQGSLVNPYA